MTDESTTGWRSWFAALRSRKVRVALATIVAAFAAEYGFKVSEDLVFTILGIGASLILGIAHEDAAEKGNPNGNGQAKSL